MKLGWLVVPTLLFAAHPVFAEEAPCPYVPERLFGEEWRKVALRDDDEACSALKDLVADFNRLRAAADLSPEEVSLRFKFDNITFWSSFMPQDRQVEISWPTLLLFGRDPAMRQAHLSHELGHAFQKRAGEQFNFLLVASPHSRYIEGSADLLGRRFLDIAGYPPDTAARGWEATAAYFGFPVRGPDAKLDDPDPAKTHPTFKTRIFNLVMITGRSAEPLTRADFNDFGRLKPGRWFTDPNVAESADRLIDDPEVVERIVAPHGPDFDPVAWFTSLAIARAQAR